MSKNTEAKKLILQLSPESVQSVIDGLKDHKIWLNNKCQELEYRICKEIQAFAQNMYNSSYWNTWTKDGGADTHQARVNVTVERDSEISLVIANGEDAVWVEFGTGVYHNGAVGQSPNPNGEKLGFTIGSYGDGNGKKEAWGYYDEETGELTFTRGVSATKPLYYAVKNTLGVKLYQIAKEVFAE